MFVGWMKDTLLSYVPIASLSKIPKRALYFNFATQMIVFSVTNSISFAQH